MHHDWDHTFGIKLLLARYYLEQAGIPTLSEAIIYMNTHAGFRPRNFRHEREIETLAAMLKASKFIREIKPIIIDGPPERPVNDEPSLFFLCYPQRNL